MIIDRIVDRMDDIKYYGNDSQYSDIEFYRYVTGWGEIGVPIARAMDGGTEEDIKRALNAYIVDNDYNPALCDFVNGVNWLQRD